MLDHVSITVRDIAKVQAFYDAIMTALDVVKVGAREDWLGYGERARPDHPERVYMSIRKGKGAMDDFGCHLCFKAKTRAAVDAFWQAGIEAGGASYYAAFVRDPDGNRLEAVCHTNI